MSETTDAVIEDSSRPAVGDRVIVRYDITAGMTDARVRGTVKTAGSEIEIDPDSRRMKTATVDLETGDVTALKDGGSGFGMITLRGEVNSIVPAIDG